MNKSPKNIRFRPSVFLWKVGENKIWDTGLNMIIDHMSRMQRGGCAICGGVRTRDDDRVALPLDRRGR